jgi:NADH-quinone oxidoreductase subunit L
MTQAPSLLTLLLAMPFVGWAVMLLLVPERGWKLAWRLGTLITGLGFGLVVFLSVYVFGSAISLDLAWHAWLNGTSLFLYFDAATALLLLAVWGVGFAVTLFSGEYMREEPEGRVRYFAWLSFFLFAMNLLVLAGSLLTLLIGWEMVGLASYVLIGHWHKRPDAAYGSLKAILVNRVGDLLILSGILLLWPFSTLPFDTMLNELTMGAGVQAEAGWLVRFGGALIVFGALAKSAQIPFQVWLPDAMAGPTPISALLHAATMVAAGVYLIFRTWPLLSPEAMAILAGIGATTALLAALSALVQWNLKRLLAYSTLSQLGLMVTALGLGAPEAAYLHLFSHAFFKAGLFLSAGALFVLLERYAHHNHMHFDVQDIRQMGGLRRYAPRLAFAFVVFGACLAGLPLSAAFLSKEVILEAVIAPPIFQHIPEKAVFAAYIVGLYVQLAIPFTLFLTAAYTMRMLYWVVFSPSRTPLAAIETKEKPNPSTWLAIPLVFLAIGSGFWLLTTNPLHLGKGWWQSAFKSPFALASGGFIEPEYLTAFSLFLTLTGLGFGYWLARREVRVTQGAGFQSLFAKVLRGHFGFDALYQYALIWPVTQLSLLLAWIDQHFLDASIDYGGKKVFGRSRDEFSLTRMVTVIDNQFSDDNVERAEPQIRTGFLHAGEGSGGIARAFAWFDTHGIDALLLGLAATPYRIGQFLWRFHTGRVQGYLLWSLLILLASAFLLIRLGWL